MTAADVDAGGALLVDPATVVDTTSDPRWVPLRVTVALDEPWVGRAHHRIHLDAPLAWCAHLEMCEHVGHRPPPLRPNQAPHDYDVGLATWTVPTEGHRVPDRCGLAADGGLWGWACSGHTVRPLVWTAVQTRKKPPTEQHARYTVDRRHHLAAGPHKARDITHPAAWVDTLTWDALGDPARVAALLGRLTHVGALRGHGYGRVAEGGITVDTLDETERDGWRARAWPDPDAPRVDGLRAPYWHPSRQVPCR